MAPARKPASGPTPRPKPTAIGAKKASRPGVTSSRSESRVQMSTTRPYCGRTSPVMIPGISRNWRRTSNTIAPIAVGFGLGVGPLAGFLAGAIAAGGLMGVFLANSGGTWDNAQKIVEDGQYG